MNFYTTQRCAGIGQIDVIEVDALLVVRIAQSGGISYALVDIFAPAIDTHKRAIQPIAFVDQRLRGGHRARYTIGRRQKVAVDGRVGFGIGNCQGLHARPAVVERRVGGA